MKAHERRATGAYPYFKLDAWDGRIGAYRPFKGRGQFPTEDAARAAASAAPGRYRVLRVDDGGSTLLEPFEV